MFPHFLMFFGLEDMGRIVGETADCAAMGLLYSGTVLVSRGILQHHTADSKGSGNLGCPYPRVL